MKQTPNDHINLQSKIKLYEDLLRHGGKNSKRGAFKRLVQLNKQMDEYNNWLRIPYSRRRFIVSPAIEPSVRWEKLRRSK